MSQHSGSSRPEASGHLTRRAFLKAATVAAALGSGAVLGEGTSAWGAAFRGGSPAASGSRAAVLLGGAEVRPPSVPLAVRSPYLSTWLPGTELAGTEPQFWYGTPRGLAGLIRIDGRIYAWAGQPQVNGVAPPALTQTNLEVTATRSTFVANAGGVELTAEWLSPIEPGDLRRQSVPLTLLTLSATTLDGAAHEVQLYADITGEWASPDETSLIEWQLSTTASNRYWSVSLQDPSPLSESAQMAQWGSAVWGLAGGDSQSFQSGSADSVRAQFSTAGSLADTDDTDFRAVDDDQPVFAFVQDLGTIKPRSSAQPASLAVGYVRTPLISYGAEATPILPWWTTQWSTWQDMADEFLADAAAARERAVLLDRRIQDAATAAAGPGYSAICALAARQCYGGMEVAIGPEGDPWVLGKEISSDGDVNTVDIFDQAYLMWLWLDPGFVPLEMEPILTWCASPGWQDQALWADIPSWEDSQTRYCVHDLGVYPVASGLAPGAGEQMPIEESAGMLIMAASYARRVGAASARPFLQKWQLLWTQWAEYLLTQVPTPATQLTTDDWAPVYLTPTGSTNLGIKAIIGLAAAGQIAGVIGDDANAARWSQAAKDNVEPWVSLSLDPSGEYLNLEQGASGTWSSVYNAFYELVIGEHLVPEHVKALQADFYVSQLEQYGLELQTAAGEVNKVAWQLYLPAWLSAYSFAPALLDRDVAYIDQTPSLVPYGDRYNVETAVNGGVFAHPTVGAVFAVMFADGPLQRLPVTTTLEPSAVLVEAGQSGTVTLVSTNTTDRPFSAQWSIASPGSGIAITPDSGTVELGPRSSVRTTLTVSASATATPTTVTVPVSVTGSGAKGGAALASSGAYLEVSVPYQSLAAAFNNVGITDDSDPSPGNFDGYGNSFSSTALAEVGIKPGSPVTSGGVTFTWPEVAAGQPDNVVATGQTVDFSESGSTLGFLGVANNGVASGTGTVIYTDGSTQAFTIDYQNWILATPVGDDLLVATATYFNRTTKGAARTPSLFSAFVSLESGKTIAGITLPDVSSATVSEGSVSLHVFAIATA